MLVIPAQLSISREIPRVQRQRRLCPTLSQQQRRSWRCLDTLQHMSNLSLCIHPLLAILKVRHSWFFLLDLLEKFCSKVDLTHGWENLHSSLLMVRRKPVTSLGMHLTYYVVAEAEDEEIVRATLISKTPFPYTAADITCLKLGETKVEITVGNKPSTTNK